MVAFVGVMWACLAGSAMADDTAASSESSAPLEQLVTASTLAELQQTLQPWVTSHLQAQVGAVQVEPLGGWRWPTRSGSANRWRVTWRPAEARLGGWLVALHAVRDDDGDGDVGPGVDVRFFGRAQQLVWRLRAPVQKGDPIACSALRQDMRVKRSDARIWQGPCEALSAFVARRSLAAGDVLTESDVGPQPAVHSQQAVQVWSRSQGIVIQARGQALADASIGQRVPVRMAGQSSVLQATVMAPGELQIMEGME